MVVRKAVFLDAESVLKNNETFVRLYLKGTKGRLYLYFPYDPYLYVDAVGHEDQLLKLKVRRKDGTLAAPKRVEETARTVEGTKKRLLKLYAHSPSDLPLFKDAMPYQCYETNIPFGKRFIMDLGLTPFLPVSYEREGQIIKKIIKGTSTGQLPLSSLAFDLETYNPGGAPHPEKDPILMASYGSAHGKVITYKKYVAPYVSVVADEKSLLEVFSKHLAELDPDIMYGYNSSQFDLPYIRTRCDALKIDVAIGTRPGMRKVTKGMITGMKIPGRIHIDLYPLVRFFGFIGLIKAQEFTLQAIAKEVLGETKKSGVQKNVWQLWDDNQLEILCEYSKHDAELTWKLGEYFLPLVMELSRLTRVPLFDCALSTSGQLVESLLMCESVHDGIILPSKPSGNEVQARELNPVQGAYVKLPEPGVYENIAVMDFRGLYPSIIVSYNIDPFTLNPKDANVPHHVSPTGALFRKDVKGLVPKTLEWMMDLRTSLKHELKKHAPDSPGYKSAYARQFALKIINNSFFGYLGYARSRWYSKECTESITAWGRKHITDVITHAEKKGFKVLYSDTDSIMLLYSKKEDVLSFMSEINKSLPEKMELELEAFYPRGVFVSKRTGASKDSGDVGAKKKYALISEDGRIKVRGFELVRRDWSIVARETQKAVLEAILKDGSKEKAVKIVRDTIELLRSGTVALDKLAITTQLTKSPDHYEIISPEVSAVRKAGKERASTFGRGSSVRYVITTSGKTVSEKAMLLDLAKDYDPEYYINNQIIPSCMKILKELGYDEHSLKVGGKQKGLGDFF